MRCSGRNLQSHHRNPLFDFLSKHQDTNATTRVPPVLGMSTFHELTLEDRKVLWEHYETGLRAEERAP